MNSCFFSLTGLMDDVLESIFRIRSDTLLLLALKERNGIGLHCLASSKSTAACSSGYEPPTTSGTEEGFWADSVIVVVPAKRMRRDAWADEPISQHSPRAWKYLIILRPNSKLSPLCCGLGPKTGDRNKIIIITNYLHTTNKNTD